MFVNVYKGLRACIRYTMYVPGTCSGPERVSDPWKLELQIVMSCR